MATEIKQQIASLKAQIATFKKQQQGLDKKDPFYQDLEDNIKRMQEELNKLLSENPHDDGTGRKQPHY